MLKGLFFFENSLYNAQEKSWKACLLMTQTSEEPENDTQEAVFNMVIPPLWDSKKPAKANAMTPLKSRTQTRSRPGDNKTMPDQTGSTWRSEPFTEIREWVRLEGTSGTSGPTSLLKQTILEHMGQECVWRVLEYWQWGRLQNLSWQSSIANGQSHSTEDLSCIQMELSVHQFLHIISYSVPWHHWEKPGSISLAPPLHLRYLHALMVSPLSCFFCRLNIPSSFNLSS